MSSIVRAALLLTSTQEMCMAFWTALMKRSDHLRFVRMIFYPDSAFYMYFANVLGHSLNTLAECMIFDVITMKSSRLISYVNRLLKFRPILSNMVLYSSSNSVSSVSSG